VFPQLAERFDLPVRQGAWVQSVTPGGPADRAGLRGGSRQVRFQDRAYAVGGDVIVALAGRPIRQETDVAKALVALKPGDDVDIVVMRDGRRQTLRVRLGERPLDAPRAG
jgi:S1-C subfamily serine protease